MIEYAEVSRNEMKCIINVTSSSPQRSIYVTVSNIIGYGADFY